MTYPICPHCSQHFPSSGRIPPHPIGPKGSNSTPCPGWLASKESPNA